MILGLVARTTAIILLLVASLMTFPSAIPWMVATWMMWHCVAVLTGRSARFQLLSCVAILFAKRVGWTFSMSCLCGAMLVVAVAQFRHSVKHAPISRRFTGMSCLLLWISFIIMAGDRYYAGTPGHLRKFNALRPIACLGDSLSSGIGRGTAYPIILKRLLTTPVVDLSVPGITVEEGLAIFEQWLVDHPKHQLQAIVIELGGNNYLNVRSRAETMASLEKLIKLSLSQQLEVVLIEIPRGFITDKFYEMERDLARRYDLQLIADSTLRSLVLWGPFAPPGMWTSRKMHLSDDGLHPNARGAEHIAQAVTRALIQLYGPQVKR